MPTNRPKDQGLGDLIAPKKGPDTMSVSTPATPSAMPGAAVVRNTPTHLVTLSGEVNRTYRDMTRERMSLAVSTEGGLTEYADELVAVFDSLTEAERKIGDAKQKTGAYVYRATFLATGDKAKASAAVKDRLGIKAPTRYGYLSKLHFTFGFDFTDTEWTALVKAADQDKDFRKLLNRDETAAPDAPRVQRKDLLDHLAMREAEAKAAKIKAEQEAAARAIAERKAAEEAAEAKRKADEAAASGQDTGERRPDVPTVGEGDSTTPPDESGQQRAAQPNGLGTTATRTRGAILSDMARDRNEFGTPRDATEWARLNVILVAITAALDAADSDVRAEGMAKYAAITADESA